MITTVPFILSDKITSLLFEIQMKWIVLFIQTNKSLWKTLWDALPKEISEQALQHISNQWKMNVMLVVSMTTYNAGKLKHFSEKQLKEDIFRDI